MLKDTKEQVEAMKLRTQDHQDACKLISEPEQIQDTDMHGFAEAKDDQNESDGFIVPPHFKIFKSLTEGKCKPQIHEVSSKPFATEQYRTLKPMIGASNDQEAMVVSQGATGICKCGLEEDLSFLERYKICRHCEPPSEISGFQLGSMKPW